MRFTWIRKFILIRTNSTQNGFRMKIKATGTQWLTWRSAKARETALDFDSA